MDDDTAFVYGKHVLLRSFAFTPETAGVLPRLVSLDGSSSLTTVAWWLVRPSLGLPWPQNRQLDRRPRFCTDGLGVLSYESPITHRDPLSIWTPFGLCLR